MSYPPGTGRKPGGVAIRQVELQEVRAMAMLQQKIAGKPDAEIARNFNCHSGTVKRWLGWAVRNGLVKKYENQLISDLVPMALGVIKKQLQDGDAFAAKDILDKMMKLGERFEQKEIVQDDRDLKAYIAAKRDKQLPSPISTLPYEQQQQRALPSAPVTGESPASEINVAEVREGDDAAADHTIVIESDEEATTTDDEDFGEFVLPESIALLSTEQHDLDQLQ